MQAWMTVGQEDWVEDEEQDWEESSVEEGELIEEGEEEWWASGRGGGAAAANSVNKSFQKEKQRKARFPGERVRESRLEERKAQERPPLLSPGTLGQTGIDWTEVRFAGGGMTFCIRRSKTDQSGSGASVFLRRYPDSCLAVSGNMLRAIDLERCLHMGTEARSLQHNC
ncbi:hypothetical protein NDU88_000994 [Pleurodeles waltl]|uniref:Uncharacterized protein n=1 Tax=Pleurodeles waltl TaxID=8319 RepID=A0AAV7S952_PLEWA|nr:hypothetical protein NDU88_000994 [Pleurodeles waltl]